jgi:hypothetical protein
MACREADGDSATYWKTKADKLDEAYKAFSDHRQKMEDYLSGDQWTEEQIAQMKSAAESI